MVPVSSIFINQGNIESSSNRALLIFIKNAQKGKVKTRLANTVGETKALKIYQALVQYTRKITQSVSAYRYVFYSDYVEDHDDWPTIDFAKYVQQGADLGQRMEQAFSLALEQRDKAIIIGSDCASLSPALIEEAFQKLDTHPFVIGPALDGGYYLLGMRHFTPSLFENIHWSTSTVFQETIQKIEALHPKTGNSSYHLLPELSDIDFEEDWEKYGWELDSV